jgi:cell division protein FtsI/penicillin-binding protein 2
MRKGFASSYRIVLVAALVGLSLAAVIARLYDLHVLDRARFLKMVTQARTGIIVENARRGDIRDSRGQVLAMSRPRVILGVDPQVVLAKDEEKWPQLAALIGVPLPEIRRIFTTKTGSSEQSLNVPKGSAKTPSDPSAPLTFEFKLSDDLTKDEVINEILDEETDEQGGRLIRWAKLHKDLDESVYEQVLKLGIKGVRGDRVYRRSYPHNSLAAHIVGYVNKENVPSFGIEEYADFYLRGQSGWLVSELDGKRRELAQFRTREVTPVDGFHVVLSLDNVIQDIIEQELVAIHQTYHPVKASVIVSDAHTGFILGLANTPTFNLNEYGKADIASMRNVAVADVLEPGSTFKIVAAAGALDLGLVTPQSRFDVLDPKVLINGKERTLPKDDHPFERPLSLREVLSHSSNRGAARCAFLLGEQHFIDYVRAFGFGEKSGFPIGGEVRGLVIPPDKWDALTFTRMPIGHSVNGTPLQIHYAMAAIASGGELLQPQIIREIRDSQNEVVFRYDTLGRRRVMTLHTAQQMAQMLTWVTVPNEGTAPEAGIPGFEVAGKTGTTKKIVEGKYSDRKHVASFVGFFPASRPELVISVIIDEASTGLPSGVAYGSKVAAPSFKHIGEKLIQYLNIKPVSEPIRPTTKLVASTGGRR